MLASKLLKTFLLFSFTAFAVEIEPPPNLEPSKLEKENIERKYKATAPELEQVQKKEEEKKQYIPPPPPPPVYEYKIDVKKHSLTIQQGERLQKTNKENAGYLVNSNANSEGQITKPEQSNIYTGYCYPEFDVDVSIEEVYVPVNCILNRRQVVKGEMMLLPVPQNYSLKAVLTQIDGKPVKNSIKVLTGDKTSSNIASEVDKRLIANVLLLTARDTGKNVANATANIFNSAATTTLTNTGGFGVITVDPTASLNSIPKMAMYTALANLLKTSSNELLADKNRLPPLFKLKKNTELYVEFEL